MIFVSYMPGGCGKFISALIWSLFEKKQVLISDMGSAHSNFWAFYGVNTYIEKFWDDLLEHDGLRVSSDNIDKFYVIDEASPGPKIGQLHTTNFGEILDRFPGSKIVFIKHADDDEIREASENFFMKYFLEYRPTVGDASDTLSRDNWHKYINLHLDVFPDPSIEPWNITKHQLKEIIDRYSKIPYWKNWTNDYTGDHRILTMQYRDIVNGTPVILETLSEFLGTNPSKNHRMILHRYARSQPRLSEWIDWFE